MNLLEGVGRVLFVHAHPDDETLSTGALISRLTAAEVDVIVLTATRGEAGSVRPGPLTGLVGTPILAQRRERELGLALKALGVKQGAFLGNPPARAAGLAPRRYRDSGMKWINPKLAGPADNVSTDALTAASLDEVAGDIAAYIQYVRPDVVITYDADGGYGHPDHVRVRAATEVAAIETRVPLAEVLVDESAPVGDWFDLSDEFPVVVAALGCHSSQLIVEGREVVHVGGRREEIVTRVGLRNVGSWTAEPSRVSTTPEPLQ